MITLRALDVVVGEVDVCRLHGEFQTQDCVVLPRLLDASLSSLLLPMVESGLWRDKVHEALGKEVVLNDDRALNLLHFAVNAPAFLDGVRRITGCHDISWFGGRIYRVIPGTDHHDSWHDDVSASRLVGMSINLSPEGYEGGLFQLRERETKTLLFEVANTELCHATLFRISPSLQHRVETVRGNRPRTAFAGWFCSGKSDLLSRLRTAVPAPEMRRS